MPDGRPTPTPVFDATETTPRVFNRSTRRGHDEEIITGGLKPGGLYVDIMSTWIRDAATACGHLRTPQYEETTKLGCRAVEDD